ncbi:MAG: hypothetical protein ACRECX_11220 [Methyloceanibacter sp.]|uniref:hypothetical protein n=1 Tax=Methyloceanibacter sp. TaxID=1965321 RepID=UPI003D6CEBC4
METISPSADRIGAALRALRQTHTPGAGDKTALGAKCLHAVIAQLAAEGVTPEDLQPLVDLEAALGTNKQRGEAEIAGEARDRRRSASPSPTLLARAAAVIDLLVKAGYDESEAAQIVMRRMVGAGVPPPTQGGDARGWRRLLEWRNTILQGFGEEDAKHEYRAFTRELEAIPAGERVQRVLDGRLWDRRRNPR